jgi:hypothetical protein
VPPRLASSTIRQPAGVMRSDAVMVNGAYQRKPSNQPCRSSKVPAVVP